MSKKVYLIMPVFAGNSEVENDRVERIREWENTLKEKVCEIFKDSYNVDVTHPKVGDPTDIGSISAKYTDITKKGLMVQHELQRIRDLVKYSDFPNSFFVLLDGSGKIDFNTVYSVLNGLKKKKAIFGCRPTSYAVSDERKKIELFENYLVSQKYKVVLPDAQCGCWGFNLDILKDLPLIANSYEIELDVVINAIERNVDFGFVEVKINDNRNVKITNFSFDSNFQKLEFLCHKLLMDKDILKFHYKKFAEETTITLPKKYIDFFDKVSPQQSNYKKFDCIGSCVKGCEKAIKTMWH